MKKELTIDIAGIEFDVKFDYQPPEKEVRYDSNMEGYPGCGAEIEGIHYITHKGTDFTDFFENWNLWEKLDEMLLEKMEL